MSRLLIVNFRTTEKVLLHLGFEPVRQKLKEIQVIVKKEAQCGKIYHTA